MSNLIDFEAAYEKIDPTIIEAIINTRRDEVYSPGMVFQFIASLANHTFEEVLKVDATSEDVLELAHLIWNKTAPEVVE